MREVTKEVFFKHIGPENVHPRCEPDHAIWEIVGTRKVIGRSEPGYASPHGIAKRYWLTDEFANEKIGAAA
ncbi:hypothetical protein IB265_32750 [Ensifer sp. ENS10]|uniref:hypothetical protein n=1 Tax=Ensifer sp. ENS10 TaxID=2769286 RepID=UPI0017819F79|nr:hypothetical protein [Ensifer sp. ENS10]MBD9511527.1 hypothetical protein [Ensifer sp. ENS10]